MPDLIVNKAAVTRLSEAATKELSRAIPTIKRGHKGMVRSRMPQLECAKSFVQWLASEHNLPSSMEYVEVGSLKPTQKHFDTEKVKEMAENAQDGKFKDIDAPIVVSRDLRILDGHHRWAALRVLSPKNKMGIYRISTTIEDLIKLARQYGAKEEALHEKVAHAFFDEIRKLAEEEKKSDNGAHRDRMIDLAAKTGYIGALGGAIHQSRKAGPYLTEWSNHSSKSRFYREDAAMRRALHEATKEEFAPALNLKNHEYRALHHEGQASGASHQARRYLKRGLAWGAGGLALLGANALYQKYRESKRQQQAEQNAK